MQLMVCINCRNKRLGVFFSHRNVWRRIANGKNNFGAVFEDDLTFSNDARYLISDDGWIPEDVDIIKIETTSRKVLLLPPFSEVIPGRQLGNLASVHMGGGGYILSKNIAARLLTFHTKVWCASGLCFIFTKSYDFTRRIEVANVSCNMCATS